MINGKKGESSSPSQKKRKGDAKGKGVNKLYRDWKQGAQLERWPLYLSNLGAAGVR